MTKVRYWKKTGIWIGAFTAILGIGAIAAGPVMSDVEIPPYQILSSAENIEIRSYQPMIIAEVQIPGQRGESIGAGFRLLADYIFGNNSGQQDIAMTAPVQQQLTGDSWQISFVMPAQYDLDTLPVPKNGRVTLREMPATTFVTIHFSGTNSDDNITAHENKLKAYIAAHHLSPVGTPKYAFYNPPWTLPALRRNEVMIALK